jgi:inosine-uridine nucleoside N-ribohydrolase
MDSRKIVSLILDTDMDTDCDDAGALVILNNYMKLNKVEMLGVICDAPTEFGGSCIEVINDCFLNSHIPIGVVKTSDFSKEEQERFQSYYTHVNSLPPDVFYNKTLGSPLEKKACDYPSAVEVYRKLLAASEDNSVVICCIGLLTALEQLLKSEPDGFSPLNGFELVKAKVSTVVSMACMSFPKGWEAFNWRMDKLAAEYVVNNCPVQICVSNFGSEVLTGSTLSSNLSADNPLRKAYEKYLGGPFKSRPSWDQIALLYAMGQDEELFCEKSGYTVSYDSTDNCCTWIKAVNGRKDKYINLKVSNEKMAEYIENLMCLTP